MPYAIQPLQLLSRMRTGTAELCFLTTVWAMQAVGLIAFQIDHNTAAIAEHTELLLAIAGVMENGSEAEQIAACGAICNVCASGNVSEKFAKCEPLVRAILKLSRAGGDVRLRAVGCFTNMSNGANPHEVCCCQPSCCRCVTQWPRSRGKSKCAPVRACVRGDARRGRENASTDLVFDFAGAHAVRRHHRVTREHRQPER